MNAHALINPTCTACRHHRPYGLPVATPPHLRTRWAKCIVSPEKKPMTRRMPFMFAEHSRLFGPCGCCADLRDTRRTAGDKTRVVLEAIAGFLVYVITFGASR